MNKYIIYTTMAILLGIITITVPITLFNTENNQNTLHDRNNSGFLPEGVDNTYEPTPTESDLKASPISSLKSIGLMVVPSFLIALGAFLIRKKND